MITVEKLDAKVIEKKWRNEWSLAAIYEWNSSESRENNFVIDTPPPTVSGQLHMGHVFSYTQIDFIARFQRMLGKNVFFPIGFDDNGLPTERLVEKLEKVRAKEVGRAKFTELCQKTITNVEEIYRNLYKNLGN